MGRREIGKFSSARAVWMPQYASEGISRDPRESVSMRVRVIASRAMCCSPRGSFTAVCGMLRAYPRGPPTGLYTAYTRLRLHVHDGGQHSVRRPPSAALA